MCPSGAQGGSVPSPSEIGLPLLRSNCLVDLIRVAPDAVRILLSVHHRAFQLSRILFKAGEQPRFSFADADEPSGADDGCRDPVPVMQCPHVGQEPAGRGSESGGTS